MSNVYRYFCYDLTKIAGTYVARRMFDENAVYYDIKNRNTIMANQAGENEDDDDDDLF